MGAYCTKHCPAHVPNTRLWRRRGRRGVRRSQTARTADLEARASQCDCSRLRSVRDTAFRSGFYLGLKVRTLERLLHRLDDSAELSSASAPPADADGRGPVPRSGGRATGSADPDPPAVVPDPQCSLTNMVKEDFKWVLEPDRCEEHHPGSPSSLP